MSWPWWPVQDTGKSLHILQTRLWTTSRRHSSSGITTPKLDMASASGTEPPPPPPSQAVRLRGCLSAEEGVRVGGIGGAGGGGCWCPAAAVWACGGSSRSRLCCRLRLHRLLGLRRRHSRSRLHYLRRPARPPPQPPPLPSLPGRCQCRRRRWLCRLRCRSGLLGRSRSGQPFWLRRQRRPLTPTPGLKPNGPVRPTSNKTPCPCPASP